MDSMFKSSSPIDILGGAVRGAHGLAFLPRRLQHGQQLGGLGAEGWIGPGHTGVFDQERGPIQGGVSRLMLNSDKKHLLESYG